MSNLFNKDKPLRYGMVGGGSTSQIGYSHRVALRRDSYYKLLAGAFDIDAERGKKFGESLGLETDRIYSDYRKMLVDAVPDLFSGKYRLVTEFGRSLFAKYGITLTKVASLRLF